MSFGRKRTGDLVVSPENPLFRRVLFLLEKRMAV